MSVNFSKLYAIIFANLIKIVKIHWTIDACVADYKTYIQSQYYKKYSSKVESAQDSTALSISELLIL